MAGQVTSGDRILLNAPYITARSIYCNYIAHEMMHVYQSYPQPLDRWLTEGLPIGD